MQKEDILNYDFKKFAFMQRENFISTINHDLKVPVIAQIRALELLVQENLGGLNNSQKEILTLTLDSCRSTYNTLSQILSMYKYENQDMLLDLQPIHIVELLEKILDGFKNVMEERKIKIIMNNNSKNPMIQADKKQLKKALGYIFEYCLLDSKSQKKLLCEIKKLDKMLIIEIFFDSKYSVEDISHNNYQMLVPNQMDKVGRNLGLYLAKQIIKSHCGYFESKNAEMKSCCIIKLPLSNINNMT